MIIVVELNVHFGLVKDLDIFPTSFQQPYSHRGDLDDVFIVTDVSCKHSWSLSGKSTRVQLHYLLTGLKDLHKNMFSVSISRHTAKQFKLKLLRVGRVCLPWLNPPCSE